MNTTHIEERSSSQRFSQDLEYSQDSVVGDPFGIKQAGADALRKKPWILAFSARLLDSFIMFLGLLPFVLLVLLPILVIRGSAGSLLNYIAFVFGVWVIAFVIHQLRLIPKKPNLLQPMDTGDNKPDSVVVIGAGPVGLAMVKECLEMGLNVKCSDPRR